MEEPVPVLLYCVTKYMVLVNLINANTTDNVGTKRQALDEVSAKRKIFLVCSSRLCNDVRGNSNKINLRKIRKRRR